MQKNSRTGPVVSTLTDGVGSARGMEREILPVILPDAIR